MKPNVLIIMADDMGHWAMRCAGNEDVLTPNLDRLAASGIRFENFFCVSPVSSPARASFLTGRIPSQHGVHDWLKKGNIDDPDGMYRGVDRPVEYLNGIRGFTDYLAQDGYVCGISGKWHLGDNGAPQKGHTFWKTHAFGGGHYYDWQMFEDGKLKTETRYVTDVITENAVEFLEANQANRFCLSVHYTAPHSPWDKAEHPEEVWDLYDCCDFSATPDLPLSPLQINSAPAGAGERRKELLRGYYTAITAMDHGIGTLLDWLEESGLRENTLIIFSSDNGMNMGHHGVWGKGNATFPLNMWDTSVKVPVIFSLPGTFAGNAICSSMLSHYDVFPTLLDLLRIPHDEDSLPGSSFAGYLRGGEPPADQDVIIYDEYGPVRMIRTDEYKYVHRYPYGPHEFYDLKNDPDEMYDQISNPQFTLEIQTLRAKLDDWFFKYVNPAIDGTREAVYGKGQLNLAGISAAGNPAYANDVCFYTDEKAFHEEA
ncbi:MAG: sulfatase-like hydrolase/transferase [Kiritimatiellales bacterium]